MTILKLIIFFPTFRNGHVEIVKILGRKVDPRDQRLVGNDGCTPLHFASKNGHYECVKALIQILGTGRWIRFKNRGIVRIVSGGTALDMALNENHSKIAKYLKTLGLKPSKIELGKL